MIKAGSIWRYQNSIPSRTANYACEKEHFFQEDNLDQALWDTRGGKSFLCLFPWWASTVSSTCCPFSTYKIHLNGEVEFLRPWTLEGIVIAPWQSKNKQSIQSDCQSRVTVCLRSKFWIGSQMFRTWQSNKPEACTLSMVSLCLFRSLKIVVWVPKG